MNISREIKKVEAINRMKALDLFKPCINAFKTRNEVQLSEITGGLYEFSNDDDLNTQIENFEKEYNALVYHVIHTYTTFGELYNFLFVGDYEEEWEMENENIQDGYTFAYVWNKTDEWCSEFGSIMVEEKFGGLVRVG